MQHHFCQSRRSTWMLEEGEHIHHHLVEECYRQGVRRACGMGGILWDGQSATVASLECNLEHITQSLCVHFFIFKMGTPSVCIGLFHTHWAISLAVTLLGKIPWRRKWQPTPVFLPGRFHGQRGLAGYSPWGRTQLDTVERAGTCTSSHRSPWPQMRHWSRFSLSCTIQPQSHPQLSCNTGGTYL